MRDTFGWLLFRVIGNSLKFLITQKGTNVPMMRTRAKQKHVASDALGARMCQGTFFFIIEGN